MNTKTKLIAALIAILSILSCVKGANMDNVDEKANIKTYEKQGFPF